YHNEPNPILSSQQVHVLENGSLYLRALEPKHAGVYICDATNGVNKAPVEARAHVTVGSLPKVVVQNTLGAGGGAAGAGGASGGTSGGGGGGSLFRSGIHTGASSAMVERLVLRKGAQTQLLCSALGADMPMTAQWLRSSAAAGFQVRICIWSFKIGSKKVTFL